MIRGIRSLRSFIEQTFASGWEMIEMREAGDAAAALMELHGNTRRCVLLERNSGGHWRLFAMLEASRYRDAVGTLNEVHATGEDLSS